jgi:hypothetical protein
MKRRDFLKLLCVSPALGVLPKKHRCEWQNCGQSLSTADDRTTYTVWHNGDITHRMQWDRQLSDSEIARLYQSPFCVFNGSHLSTGYLQ